MNLHDELCEQGSTDFQEIHISCNMRNDIYDREIRSLKERNDLADRSLDRFKACLMSALIVQWLAMAALAVFTLCDMAN